MIFSLSQLVGGIVSILQSINNGDPLQDSQYIHDYEKVVAKYHGVRYAFNFASGRMGYTPYWKLLTSAKGTGL